ncbi:hypothetical protein A2U01_0103153, partial [Trifolium medium]|nr:hypothetical protein [Trifolium medium]
MHSVNIDFPKPWTDDEDAAAVAEVVVA